MQNKILLKPVLYTSHDLKRSCGEYYERLQALRHRGEWEAWIKFFLARIPWSAARQPRPRAPSSACAKPTGGW